jgi:very-short-patch-repair endonuclease
LEPLTMTTSDLEHAFMTTWHLMCRANHIDPVDPLPEHRFQPPRKWRFDFAWPRQRVAVELEGGVWTSGRHTRPSGYMQDIDKYNAAAAAGWLVVRFSADHLRKDPQGVFETIIDCLNCYRTKGGAP